MQKREEATVREKCSTRWSRPRTSTGGFHNLSNDPCHDDASELSSYPESDKGGELCQIKDAPPLVHLILSDFNFGESEVN